MAKVEIRQVDAQGRIILPREWRNRLKSPTVLMIEVDDRLEIRPADPDLARFIDAVPAVAEQFDDYHALRKGLRRDAVH